MRKKKIFTTQNKNKNKKKNVKHFKSDIKEQDAEKQQTDQMECKE